MIHIYYGNGKGKSTAATGLAVRAKGNGSNVIFAQFIKSVPNGEVVSLDKLGVSVIRGKLPNQDPSEYTSEQKELVIKEHDRIFDRASSFNQKNTVIVFDELLDAYNESLIDREKVMEFLSAIPLGIEVILTGRDAPEEILDIADYVSEVIGHKIPESIEEGAVRLH